MMSLSGAVNNFELRCCCESGLNLPALLSRYKAYLVRMKAKGLNPFKDQPRRTDLHYTEAVGHFHLYAWLKEALDQLCVISPEFPTGNGKGDVHVRCRDTEGIIEVKSFRSNLPPKKITYRPRVCFKLALIKHAPENRQTDIRKSRHG